MFINLYQFFTPSYLLLRTPGALSRPFFITWLVVSLVLVAAAIIIRYEISARKSFPPAWSKWYRSLATMVLVMGFFSLLLLFFRYERSPFFSMRVWLVVWLLAFLYWSVRLAYRAYRRVPSQVLDWTDRERIKKYLPKH